MERGSDTHGPRQDEELKHEVEGLLRAGRQTRAEEWKQAEPSGEDEPDVDRAPDHTLGGGTPAGMTADELESRAELASWLGRSTFPAVRTALLAHVLDAQAPDRVVHMVESLPAGQEFANAGEVWQALGHPAEESRF